MYVHSVMQQQVFIHTLLIAIAQQDSFMMELDVHNAMQLSQPASNAFQIKSAYNV